MLGALSVGSAVVLAACGSSGQSKPARTGHTTPAATTVSAAPARIATVASARTVTVAPGCRATAAGDQTRHSAHYVFLMHVGPYQQMVMVHQPVTPSDEVMLGGSEATLPAVRPGPSVMRHLEVHICSRATGAVIVGANPTIDLTLARAAPRSVPIMEMEGPNDPGDYHYGNNVPLHPRGHYTVTVLLGGERAVFMYTEPGDTPR